MIYWKVNPSGQHESSWIFPEANSQSHWHCECDCQLFVTSELPQNEIFFFASRSFALALIDGLTTVNAATRVHRPLPEKNDTPILMRAVCLNYN